MGGVGAGGSSVNVSDSLNNVLECSHSGVGGLSAVVGVGMIDSLFSGSASSLSAYAQYPVIKACIGVSLPGAGARWTASPFRSSVDNPLLCISHSVLAVRSSSSDSSFLRRALSALGIADYPSLKGLDALLQVAINYDFCVGER
jgi:hypothetical protein